MQKGLRKTAFGKLEGAVIQTKWKSDVKMAIERVKTGIEGLDKALNGGIPRKNIVLVSASDAVFVPLSG